MNILLSTTAYQSKPTDKEIKDMRFKACDICIKEFVNRIKEGYTFTAMMKDNWRSKDNFLYTELLVYDIDHSDIPMNEYLDNLAVKPTVSYTSPSNCEGDYRYRLVYQLNEPIYDTNEYYQYSRSFEEQIKMSHVDSHSYEAEHYWNGSYNCTVCTYDNVLDIKTISVNKTYNRQTSKSASKTYMVNIGHISLSCTFIKDFFLLHRKDFLEKYHNDYENLEKTPIKLDDETPIIKYPSNYYEIYRPWKKVNGETRKIRDGEGRRNSLYKNGIVRRKINPSITFENMLYNLTWEFEHYYLNDGNVIDKRVIFEITKKVMKAEIYESNLGRPRYKSFVNPEYCAKYGMTPKQVMGNVRNKKQYIGEFYDTTLKDQQNIKVMKYFGLDVSLRTLQTWKKENGITKYKTKAK